MGTRIFFKMLVIFFLNFFFLSLLSYGIVLIGTKEFISPWWLIIIIPVVVFIMCCICVYTFFRIMGKDYGNIAD